MDIDESDRRTIDAALELVGADAMALADLEEMLAQRGLFDPDGDVDLLDVLCLTDLLHATSDELVIARMDLRMEGVVFTHRVTVEELTDGVVGIMPDLCALGEGIELDDSLVLASEGERLELLFDDDSYQNGFYRLPARCFDGVQPGDILAFKRLGPAVEVWRLEAEPGDGESERTSFVIAAANDAALGATQAEIATVVADVLVLNPRAWAEPIRPIGDLLDSSAYERHGAWVLLDDDDELSIDEIRDEIIESFGLQENCCNVAFDIATDAFESFDEPDFDDSLVGDSLLHACVAEALIAYVSDVDSDLGPSRLTEFAGFLRTHDKQCHAGGALLLYFLAEEINAGQTAERVLEQSIAAHPCAASIEELAYVCADRGELDEAIRLRQSLPHAEHDDELAFLTSLKPARRSTAGRNDPCPCGSAKKYKQCCIFKPTSLGLDEHALWLRSKLIRYACQRRFVPMLEGFLFEATGADEPDELVLELLLEHGTILWWMLCDERLIDGYDKSHGYRLPAIEKDMLDDWRQRPLQLFEVVNVEQRGCTLRDACSNVDYLVGDALAPALRGFDLLLGHLGKFGDSLRFIDVPIGVAPAARASAQALVATGAATASEIALWYRQFGSRK